MDISEPVRASFEEAAAVLAAFRADAEAMEGVVRLANLATTSLRVGGKLLACGNGGSMCDAMHFAEEWTGRFRSDRLPLPAIAFSDPSQLTCIANDFGYEEVFSRQLKALGCSGDVLVALSTSGKYQTVTCGNRRAVTCCA